MFVIVVVDDDVVETFYVFEKGLEALVPLGGGLVQEDDALVDETQLYVTDHSRILAQPLRLNQFRGFLIGKVHLAGLFDEAVEFFALQAHFAEGDERCADALGHLDEVFPRIGIGFAFPHNGGNIFGDVARKTDETVSLNEGHHIVFQRQ